ncbi:hypothetical protein M011DRAFT_323968 [Sporormia fimetaria CBS 119925]|uniref:Uncharacterized protein n=1 Tax=Sporormia fimetaria CBS 119925 TaxID=1340428 RepID=A0A6A6VFQ3_9PLEO|nr:hypothetical protein M011DRAFT_323968 [Sporormia fimetaria CBS 119925]
MMKVTCSSMYRSAPRVRICSMCRTQCLRQWLLASQRLSNLRRLLLLMDWLLHRTRQHGLRLLRLLLKAGWLGSRGRRSRVVWRRRGCLRLWSRVRRSMRSMRVCRFGRSMSTMMSTKVRSILYMSGMGKMKSGMMKIWSTRERKSRFIMLILPILSRKSLGKKNRITTWTRYILSWKPARQKHGILRTTSPFSAIYCLQSRTQFLEPKTPPTSPASTTSISKLHQTHATSSSANANANLHPQQPAAPRGPLAPLFPSHLRGASVGMRWLQEPESLRKVG